MEAYQHWMFCLYAWVMALCAWEVEVEINKIKSYGELSMNF